MRRAPRAADEVRWDPSQPRRSTRAVLDGVDGVVNLAGAGVGDKRWTPAYKHEILRLAHRRHPRGRGPRRVAAGRTTRCASSSGSAVGYYGDRGDEELTEASPPGHDFLADVVTRGRQATQPAVDAGASVACVRTGIVLAPRRRRASRPLLLARQARSGRPDGDRTRVLAVDHARRRGRQH